MAAVRTPPVACRFDSEVKQALSIIADRDGRSMANIMEWLIRKRCEKDVLGCWQGSKGRTTSDQPPR